ncbi:hypothetical protein L218DRAFT_948333 [Marasmius fiardii PR-910]|nr:hypothetical protein L218DRAFT_948333 [Marasmius fiardii PR-910]
MSTTEFLPSPLPVGAMHVNAIPPQIGVPLNCICVVCDFSVAFLTHNERTTPRLHLTVGDVYWCRKEERKFISIIPNSLTTAQLLCKQMICVRSNGGRLQITIFTPSFDIAVFSFDSHKSNLASKLSIHPCLLHGVFQEFAGCVVFALFDGILMLRVYALYGKIRQFAFLCVFVEVSRVINQTKQVFSDNDRGAFVFSVYSFFLTLVAHKLLTFTLFKGCHAIADMQRLGDQIESFKASEEIVFSTIDTTWESRTYTDV